MAMFVVEWSDPLQHFFVVVIDQDHCWEGLHWLILLRKTFRRHSLSAVVVQKNILNSKFSKTFISQNFGGKSQSRLVSCYDGQLEVVREGSGWVCCIVTFFKLNSPHSKKDCSLGSLDKTNQSKKQKVGRPATWHLKRTSVAIEVD